MEEFMDREQIEHDLRKAIAETKDIKNRNLIQPDTDIVEDLDVDSLDMADILIDLEELYTVELVSSYRPATRKFVDVVDYIYKVVNNK
jgi:acyl carrier protein